MALSRLGEQAHWSYEIDAGKCESDGTLKGAVKGLIESWLHSDDETVYCARCLTSAQIYSDYRNGDEGYRFVAPLRCADAETYVHGQRDPAAGTDAEAWAMLRLNESTAGTDHANTAALALLGEVGDLLPAAPPTPQRRPHRNSRGHRCGCDTRQRLHPDIHERRHSGAHVDARPGVQRAHDITPAGGLVRRVGNTGGAQASPALTRWAPPSPLL